VKGRHAVDVAEERYPRSAALRAAFCRGAAAGSRRESDEANPYDHKYPRTGFVAAFYRAWNEGWKAAICGDVVTAMSAAERV
jgi:hypothetical protein